MLAPPHSPGNVSTSSRRSSVSARSLRAYTPMAVQPRTLEEAQQRTGLGATGSAYKNYYHKLQLKTSWFGRPLDEERFNPTVVQTDSEFDNMLRDISTRSSLRVRSVHLPPGIHMNDARLRGKAHPASGVRVRALFRFSIDSQNYTLPVGTFPEWPFLPFIADVQRDIVSPDWAPPGIIGDELRVEVIPANLLGQALVNGKAALERGKEDQLLFDVTTPTFSPREITEHTTPHRRVSELVHMHEKRIGRCSHVISPPKGKLLAP